jgi:hypothetical protein
MRKHYKSITYAPKVDPVNNGTCTQTIRVGRKVAVGDVIEFHNWAGKAATRDFIDPPTGLALRDVLFCLNRKPDAPEDYQIIRWKLL